MRTSTAFSILAIAGSALAAPRPVVVENVHVVYETVVHTVYATEGQSQPTPVAEAVKPTMVYETYVPKPTQAAPKPKPKPTQAAPKPKPQPTTTEVYQPAPTQVYETSAVVVPTPSPAPVPAPSNDGYMAVVDEWRSKMGMAPLIYNANMEKLALRTVTRGNGVMKHDLILPANGEVLAPGDEGKEGFKKVFVGGWLCEIPSLPGLSGVCGEMSKGWSYQGQTGHAEILTNPDHKTIGCALVKGIWACEVCTDSDPQLPAGFSIN